MKDKCIQLVQDSAILPFYVGEDILTTTEQVYDKFIADCTKWGMSSPELRVRVAFENGYFTFDKYEMSLHCTEDEFDTMEELGIEYE